jgi:hypothetical protein
MRSAFKEAALDWAMEALGIYRVLEPTITADEELGDVTLEWKFRTFSFGVTISSVAGESTWFAVNGRTSRRGHLPLWGRIKGV